MFTSFESKDKNDELTSLPLSSSAKTVFNVLAAAAAAARFCLGLGASEASCCAVAGWAAAMPTSAATSGAEPSALTTLAGDVLSPTDGAPLFQGSACVAGFGAFRARKELLRPKGKRKSLLKYILCLVKGTPHRDQYTLLKRVRGPDHSSGRRPWHPALLAVQCSLLAALQGADARLLLPGCSVGGAAAPRHAPPTRSS